MAAVVLVVLFLLLVVLATDQAWHEDQSPEPPLFQRGIAGGGAGIAGGGGPQGAEGTWKVQRLDKC
ncbi:GM24791 [Drosophila sechellia]|uniref:GM24791 n=1 Tax=Drosophila sechellia TaxID=7238 RepID=B4HDT1_DROSE|nr:GM24791 [Drosophila sechellia]